MGIVKNFNSKQLDFSSVKSYISDVSTLFYPEKLIAPLNPNIDDKLLVEVVVIEKTGTTRRFLAQMDVLTKKEHFLNLMTTNLVLFDMKYISHLQHYVMDECRLLLQNGSIEYRNRCLGWQDIDNDGTYRFVLENATLKSGHLVKYYDTDWKFQKGTLQGQLDFLKEEIYPYTVTQLAMTLGLTSIVAGYVEPHLSVGTYVINVSSQSTTGKSTITELAGSFFGSPIINEAGMVRTFNSTKNALLAASENKYGLPILLDDINANGKEHNKTDLVYQFALNEPRSRCNSSGDLLSHRGSWSGLTIITSESPMFDNEVVTQGIDARCLTIDNLTWTQDSEHSNRIKERS